MTKEEKTTIKKVKDIIIEMFRGYPHHAYWGFFEREFEKEGEAKAVIDLLFKDGIIDVPKTNREERAYRLTSKGIDFAISMIQLDYNEKLSSYNKKISSFTKILIWLTVGLFVLSIIQIIILFSV